jgi:hypothetical protein
MTPVFDLKALVHDLAEAIQAIFEPDGAGFSIEVPLRHDRYQTVTLSVAGDVVEILSVVHELDRAAQTTIDRYAKRARGCKVTLEPDRESGSYRATVRARIPKKDATRTSVEPIIMEVASLGDGIERELTGGDVD